MNPESNKLDQALKLVIEGKKYETFDEYKLGREIKEMAGIPLDTDLFLSIAAPYNDELIENEARINLARPGIEYFYVKKKLHFSINNKPFEWYKQYISLKEIKMLGNIGEDEDVYLRIPEPYEDELLTEENKVDLARPGTEHFYSKERPFKVIIIVNGREKPWEEKTISFIQVVTLAFGAGDNNPNRVYTVTYCKGPEPKPEGTMVKGSVVSVKNKMIFNVTATDKS